MDEGAFSDRFSSVIVLVGDPFEGDVSDCEDGGVLCPENENELSLRALGGEGGGACAAEVGIGTGPELP